jgi:type I restriction enzyme S subunit
MLDTRPNGEIYIGLEHIEPWTGRLLLENQPDTVDSIVSVFGAGDVLFGKLRPYLAKVARPNFHGVCTSEILALRPVTDYAQSYAMYSLLNEEYVRWLDSLTYGAKMPRVSPDQVANTYMPMPPTVEQVAIAAFLDRETAKIDALIEKNEQLIQFLQEKRATLITRAVTKGLDPNVRMKDSGVEWLGEIPEHWEVKRIKHVAPLQGGYAFSSDSFQSDGVAVVRMNNLKRGILDLSEAAHISSSDCIDAFSLKEGDLLLGMSGSIGETGSLGNYAIVRLSDMPCQLNQRVGRFMLSEGLQRDFLLFFMAATPFTEPLLADSIGTAQFNISPQGIGQVEIGLPQLAEQLAIASFLDKETAKLDSLIAKVREAIERLKELRIALISAAVTGKIDVRKEVP